MQEHVIVESSFSAIINAPIESIDIPAWCFSLPDHEYQGGSPASVTHTPKQIHLRIATALWAARS
jgi:hypothetical protein